MEQPKLNNSQLKVMELVWQMAPVSAKELTVAAAQQYGWNKNTTYTILKGLVERGYVLRQEPGFLCTPLLDKEQVRHSKAKGLINSLFEGSATMFLASFFEEETVSARELEELQALIDRHRRSDHTK